LRTGDNQIWDRFVSEILPKLDEVRSAGGAGLSLLLTPSTSPTLDRQLKRLLKQYPSAKIHTYDPAGFTHAGGGAQAAFGENVNTVYKIENASVILVLDGNIFEEGGQSLRHSRSFIDGRRVRKNNRKMNRLYVVESSPTITGAAADHCVRIRPSQIEAFARALLARVNGQAADTTIVPWIDALAKDLLANRGKSLVMPGDFQSPAVHALAHQINAVLGNVGQTLYYTDPVYVEPAPHTLEEFIDDANAGKTKLAFILGGNPAYDVPAEAHFVAALGKIPFKVHLGQYYDETAFLCHWHIPEAHYLEMWSDARAFDGTASIVQPLIAPLYESKSIHEMISVITGTVDETDYELVRNTWRASAKGDFETWWRQALNVGVIPNSAFGAKTVSARPVAAAAAAVEAGLEIVFRPDPHILDGRFANNGWLQEMPKPLTKLTWDNVIFISPRKAMEMGIPQVDNHWDAGWGYYAEITVNGKKLLGPTWVMPGQPDDVITVFLGYGRTRTGYVGTNAGFDVNPIRTLSNPWMATGASLVKKEGRLRLACTQLHQLMKGEEPRDLIRVHPIADYEAARHGPEEEPEEHRSEAEQKAADAMTPAAIVNKKALKAVSLTLYTEKMPSDPPYDPATNQWAMSIDLNACLGCNACVVACQSENNIPIVGKEQVIFGREMHWLRIDTYYGGDDVNNAEGPYFQPMACQHCESAPCEIVCPVEATQHDDEGLNVMAYNRCVGTKYCSNNCPYKVRRFNFFRYKDDAHPSLELMRNPNVSVRTRGVMEKCTYCVQRISAARIEAKKHGGPDGGVSEGKITGDRTPIPACGQACSTGAIVFGSLTDSESEVVKLKAEPADYSVLAEVNTRPRTTYMGRFTNPNPEIVA
jgi:molybdopterin-containing oxidoreductase family iron-sulfur binding subunit